MILFSGNLLRPLPSFFRKCFYSFFSCFNLRIYIFLFISCKFTYHQWLHEPCRPLFILVNWKHWLEFYRRGFFLKNLVQWRCKQIINWSLKIQNIIFKVEFYRSFIEIFATKYFRRFSLRQESRDTLFSESFP